MKDIKIDYSRLPSQRGNHYYLDYPRHAPAIFMIENLDSPNKGKYMVCPREADVPFEGEGENRTIKAFDTPEEALKFLRQMATYKKY